MSSRPPSPPDDPGPAQPPPTTSREGLLRKYQELLAKHEALVHWLELRNEEQISTHRLSAWALETSASALALVSDGGVLLANQRWHEMSRLGPWTRMPRGPAFKALRQIAEDTAQTLGALESTRLLVERYQEQEGFRALEVRSERVGRPTEHHPQRVVLVLAHDITAQVQAEKELEQARAALNEQEHLRALGELASGIAHDLNNTLHAMKLRVEMLERDPEFAVRHRAHMDALVRIVGDASARVHRLQDFARQRPEPLGESLQLADVIQEAVAIASSELEHRAAHEGISLSTEVELPALPPVIGSASDLHYVFINLLLNARDAMPRGGTIRIRGGVVENKVVITVEDEGSGIPEAHLHSIFRPFFSTKGKQGLGLGLSMAYGVLLRAGGSITAANRLDGGAVFTLIFPVATPPAQLPQQEPVRRQAPSAPTPQRKRRGFRRGRNAR